MKSNKKLQKNTNIDQIRITISNENGTATADANASASDDSWKTATIDIDPLVDNKDDEATTEITITITYLIGNVATGTTTREVTITIDNVSPSITTSPIELPITDGEDFIFDIIFSENINISTFTAADFTITPSSLASITDIAFDGTTATITATTNIPEDQEGKLTISVGNQWQDLAANEASTNQAQQLYDIDVQRPTVSDTYSETTATENEYIITYEFSEEVVGITASNFEITTGTGTIADDITHDSDNNTVILTVTSTNDTITMSVTGYTDTSKNVGNEETATFILGDVEVTSPTIGDDDINDIGGNYTFILTFTRKILASTLTTSDFVNTDANPNIQIKTITPSASTTREFTVEFNITNKNDTANVDFTIATGTVGIEPQTNSEPIVISIDRAPRIITLDGGEFFNKEQLGNDSEFSYNLTFSEAIDKESFIANDFVITSTNGGVSAHSVITFDDDSAGATVTFAVDASTDDIFSINIPDESYTDQANNTNRETIDLPRTIDIDNIDPTIDSPTLYEPTTQSFTLTIDFNEALQFTEVTGDVPILASSDIILINATSSGITVENSGGKGRIQIELELDLSKTQATITISGDSFSDMRGNIGKGTYTLTIDIEALILSWITAGGIACQNFTFDAGDGSSSTPYQISNICQLQNIASNDVTAGGVAYSDLLSASYILTTSIDATYTSGWNDGAGFNPVGDNALAFGGGTFDGGGFTLSNLTINRGDTSFIGLFGAIIGTIKDITLDGVNITGLAATGGLVGQNHGTISNSSVSGSISGTGIVNTGGLVGFNPGTIDNGRFSGSVSGTGKNVGGLVGQNDGTISNSSVSGSVSGTGENVGGLVGQNGGAIMNSISSGNVTGPINVTSVGGFIGLHVSSSNLNDNIWCNLNNSSLLVIGEGKDSVANDEINTIIVSDDNCPQ